MSIIDRSPGGFIFIVNAILYTTVLAETGMLMSGSIVLMGVFMVLIVVLAGGLCAFIMNLMGSEAYSAGEPEPPVAVKAPQARPASRPATVPVASIRRVQGI